MYYKTCLSRSRVQLFAKGKPYKDCKPGEPKIAPQHMPRITSSVCDLHTGDCQCYKQANPAAQSLEELDFLKGACAAAQQGNAPKLQAILDRHPETIRNDNSSGKHSCSGVKVWQCYRPHKARSHVVGGSGYTPLHYAARGGHAITVKLLLQRGTARNVHAQATGNVGPKAFFVQAGAEVSAQTGAGRATPLHRAAYMGHVDVVKLL